MAGSGEEREALSLTKAGLTHRGPDELGEYSSDGARLFIARLAIIDLTSARRAAKKYESIHAPTLIGY